MSKTKPPDPTAELLLARLSKAGARFGLREGQLVVRGASAELLAEAMEWEGLIVAHLERLERQSNVRHRPRW